MIRRIKKPYAKSEIIKTLDPHVKQWFFNKFKDFTPPQRYSILNIHNKRNTLICSPTGSGKTLSAFLSIINELIELKKTNKLEDKVYAIYISPLKALGNDIEKNLIEPLNELRSMTFNDIQNDVKNDVQNYASFIRVEKRTGDTPQKTRSKMLKTPPHILITTPETFDIILTSRKFRENLRNVKWLIVDEIHSIAESKRGSDLSLAMERLELLANFTRIGISATISPLEKVAKYLVGFEENTEINQISRGCDIIDLSIDKKIDLKVKTPIEDLQKYSPELRQNFLYKQLNSMISKHRTTLIFTNTRARTEKIILDLKNKYPKNYDVFDAHKDQNNIKKGLIGAHHGSLSKEIRLKLEESLKEGKMKCVVSSTSLELGIDIGSIDLVILLGSPKSSSRALQRIGRSGHKINQISKAYMIATDIEELLECSILSKTIHEQKIDNIHIPKNPLDVLSQQLVAIANDEYLTKQQMYNIVKKSYSFETLSEKDFNETIDYLTGSYKSLENKYVYPKLRKNNEGYITARSFMTRVIYLSNLGTIADQAHIKVKKGDEYIGSLDETFSERLKKGDIFSLGGNNYEYIVKRNTSLKVKDAKYKIPTVPSWFSEMLPLSFDVGLEIARFSRFVENELLQKENDENILKKIQEKIYSDKKTARNLLTFYKQQFLFLKIPHINKIIIENYIDKNIKKNYTIFHTPYGRRLNDALSRIFAFIAGNNEKKDIEIGIDDTSFYLAYDGKINFEKYINIFLTENPEKILEQSIEKTDLFKRRFRNAAARSFLILKRYKGEEKTTARQEINSTILLKLVREIDENFVILRETRREIKEDVMDINNLKKIRNAIKEKIIKFEIIETEIPSPFALKILLRGYSDVMKIREKDEFLLHMKSLILAKISKENKEIDKDIKEEIDQIRNRLNQKQFYADKNKENEFKEISKTEKLLKQLKDGSFKERIDQAYYNEIREKILDNNYKVSEETKKFFNELFKNEIGYHWKDQIVKFIFQIIGKH